MKLYKHNQTAYEAALSLLQETGKAAVIHPTGTGKSFIAMKLCEDHPNEAVCWLSPSEYIFQTQLENWRAAGGGELPDIQFLTYARLMQMDEEELAGIRPCYIILDEFHRCGAQLWGQGVQRLLAVYPDAYLLGLTATSIRYLDNQRDMADELFGGNVASEITLGEAVVRGILNPPKYVLSVYSYQKDIEKLEARIRDTRNKAAKAFGLYPDVKLVVLAHLYGTPAKVEEIKRICEAHGALLVEDAAESLGATAGGRQTGAFGDYGVISFNGNKIITGSSGGMLLVHDEYSAEKARKWSTQSREAAPWYEHEELGYNYRMSNVIAGVVRGQFPHLKEHIEAKKKIYERYREGLKDLPVFMNPYDRKSTAPNHWLSCMLIDPSAMCENVRSDRETLYIQESGKSCPDEILDALAAFNAEGRPVWKPMHLQPLFQNHAFVTRQGNGRGTSSAYSERRDKETADVTADLFRRGLCLPSDIKMTEGEQGKVIEIVRRCFL